MCMSVFLDLATSFDTISHDISIDKMEIISIRELPLKLLQKYLNNILQSMKVGSAYSTTDTIKVSILQGTV